MQLQIPIRSVVKVSKEKTAKFIPNAVGLATAEEKHIFGSLLSRDSTFKFMTRVWKRALRDAGGHVVHHVAHHHHHAAGAGATVSTVAVGPDGTPILIGQVRVI